jgi:hypothetical protein
VSQSITIPKGTTMDLNVNLNELDVHPTLDTIVLTVMASMFSEWMMTLSLVN